MKEGMNAGIPFKGLCGGNAECCTCHIHLPVLLVQAEDYTNPNDYERDSLDWLGHAIGESRLAC